MLIFALLILTALISLMLSALALHSLTKNRLNNYLAIFTFFISIWALGDALMLFGNNLGLVRLGAVMFYVGPMVTTLYVMFFADSSPLGKPLNKVFVSVTSAIMVVLGGYIIINPDFLIQSIAINSGLMNVVTPRKDPLIIYAAYFNIYFAITYVKLIRRYRQNTGIYKSQLLLIVLGVTISSALAVTTNLTLPIQGTYDKVWMGPMFTLFFAALTVFAIIKHRYLDIKLFTTRAIAYGLVGAAMAALYAGIVSIASQTLFTDYSFTAPQQILNVMIALLIAITFGPLRRIFDRATNKLFYRDHYDTENLLNILGDIMAREIELERLTGKVIWELTTQMKLSKALIVVLDNGEVFYEANLESINHRTIALSELQAVGSGTVIKDALNPEEVPEIFNKYDLSVSVDLRSTNELVGYLLLGEKKSGDIFNGSDIKTLNILANELAIAIHNAKSYTRIQSFNQTLQIKIEEATRQLRDANVHLKKLDGIKNEFLSMATHQLNTPLSVIDGYLSMVSDGSHGKVEAQQKEYLEKALHRVRLMKRLVQDFLNVSRMEVGTFNIEVSAVDLNKVVTEEVNELGPTAKEKEVLLQFIGPNHPVPVIEIDEQKTRQAIMNLIDNAIYYAPKGEVKVYLDSDEDNVTFKVVDNGIGVPENQKAKLFQKFSRADNAKKERPSGTGVGLYLVKQVVESEGGKIIFESTEGKGSTFGFSLPIKSSAPEEPEPTPEPAEEKEEAPEAKEPQPAMAAASAAPKEKTTSYYKIIG